MFVLLMSGMILWQTSEIVHGGETNYIMATVSLFVSIFFKIVLFMVIPPFIEFKNLSKKRRLIAINERVKSINKLFADNNINIHMISTSTIRVSVVIAAKDMESAVRSLHTAFGLDSGSAYSAPLPERK